MITLVVKDTKTGLREFPICSMAEARRIVFNLSESKSGVIKETGVSVGKGTNESE